MNNKKNNANNVSRETAHRGFNISVDGNCTEQINADSDKSGDVNGRASYKELYNLFRSNNLSRFDSAYNALFITAQNNLSDSRKMKPRYDYLFRHPNGWFKKDSEHIASHGIWNVIMAALLIVPTVLMGLARLPSALKRGISEIGDGFDSTAKLSGAFVGAIRKYGLILLALVFSFSAYGYIAGAMSAVPSLELYVDGERVGFVKSTEVYYAGLDIAEDNLSKLLGISYKIPDGTASYKVVNEKNPQYISDTEIASSLMKSSEKYIATGYGLYIDDTLVAVGSSYMIMENILGETLELYNSLYSNTKKKDEIVSFANSVRIKETTVPKSVIKSKEEIRKILGLDSLSELNDLLLRDDSAEIRNLTPLDVSLMLPDIETITSADISHGLPEDSVYYVDAANNDAASNSDTADESDATPGEANEILGEHDTTVLAFKTVKTKTFTEIMPCDVEYTYDSNVLEGRKIISTPGVDGIKRATYEISYVGEEEIGRTLISEDVIKKPVTKKIKIGTRPASEYDAKTSVTGTFIMPCNGTITSYFSGRTLFGAYEFHGALDICSSFGTPIHATDGGEVVFVGRNGTYGKCIIIDHGDGIESLYAHLSEYAVEVGDKVGQGWKIAEMGKTGRVTGVHLHFEIRVNGVRQDPLDYLNQ